MFFLSYLSRYFNVQVATVQGLSGTGSLRLGAALIERYFPGAKVLISSPTWGGYYHSLELAWNSCWRKLSILIELIYAGNHKNIFNDAKVSWSEYRYYDPKTVGLDFDGMISDIKVISVWLLFSHLEILVLFSHLEMLVLFSDLSVFRDKYSTMINGHSRFLPVQY